MANQGNSSTCFNADSRLFRSAVETLPEHVTKPEREEEIEWTRIDGFQLTRLPQPGIRHVQKGKSMSNGEKLPGADKKIAAGICGILLGGLGIHKFILG